MPANTLEHPLNRNAANILRRRETTHKMFAWMDRQGDRKKLVNDTNAEVIELYEELMALKFVSTKARGEMIDAVNVLTATALHIGGRNIKPSEALYGVNGEGKHSNIIDRLIEVISDIQDDPRAIYEAYQLLWSLGVHQLGLSESSLTSLFAQADFKFRSNYPARYYEGTDILTGEQIPEEYASAAFSHFTKALKLIRAKVQRMLTPADYMQHDHLIVDWRNSEQALQRLQLTLETHPQVENGIAVVGNEIAVPSQEFTRHIDHTKNQGILFQHSK